MSETQLHGKSGTTPPASSWFDWTGYVRARYGGVRYAIDAGANVGGMVQTLLELGAEKVIAIEPVPRVHAVMAARYAGDARVRACLAGVSDQVGAVTGANVHNAWTIEPEADHKLERAVEFVDAPPFDVTLTTIDRLVDAEQNDKRWPDLIKIDVDGYDARALRGAAECLRRRPLLYLELSYLPSVLGDCCECMVRDVFARGYRMTVIHTSEVFADARACMRRFPWDSSYDVFCEVPR